MGKISTFQEGDSKKSENGGQLAYLWVYWIILWMIAQTMTIFENDPWKESCFLHKNTLSMGDLACKHIASANMRLKGIIICSWSSLYIDPKMLHSFESVW
jgi:hypothetical protein